MGVLVLAAARLAFAPRLLAPSRDDLRGLAIAAAAIAAWAGLQRLGLYTVEGERLLVAGVAGGAVAIALARGAWPGPATATTLAGAAGLLSAWALIVSRTRSAWLGTLVGLAVVALLRAPRALLLLPAAVVAVLLARPETVMDRLTVSDASSLDRYYMWQAGLDMILDKPVFGQGPGMIGERYPSYRWPEAPNPQVPHLHDNALQIGAERGLPCLVFWIWLLVALALAAWREARAARGEARLAGVAALAVLAAVMAAGAFEYNFGDSEVLMFTLLVAALPFGTRAERQPAAA
jgi:O-antigen ligase